MPTHIMLDLETLSTRHDAAILQIAAAAFDPETGETFATFNAFVRDSTGHVDVQTCAWWMQRGGVAAAVGAAVASADADTEERALEDFAMWLGSAEGGVDAIWSHGASFDLPILAAAFERHGMAQPWSFRAERDTRTLYALTPGGCPQVPVDPARKHDARYDVEVQVKQVVGAMQTLKYCFRVARDTGGLNGEPVRDLRAAPMLEREYDPGCAKTEPAPPPSQPSAAVPTRLPYDPPPVWSRAEGYTEAYANPSAALPECVVSDAPCAYGECDACQVACGEDPVNYAEPGAAERSDALRRMYERGAL